MTKQELDELEKLAKEATPGPWQWKSGNREVETTKDRALICGVVDETQDDWPQRTGDWFDDGTFIAALNPSTALRLISLAKWALEARDAMIKSVPMIKSCMPSGDHDDPSWCDEKCGDYGRTLRKCLSKFPKEE